MEVNRTQNGLITSFLQNILFCVPQKKETHTGLEWQSKWVNDDIIFIFGWIVLQGMKCEVFAGKCVHSMIRALNSSEGITGHDRR